MYCISGQLLPSPPQTPHLSSVRPPNQITTDIMFKTDRHLYATSSVKFPLLMGGLLPFRGDVMREIRGSAREVPCGWPAQSTHELLPPQVPHLSTCTCENGRPSHSALTSSDRIRQPLESDRKTLPALLPGRQ